MQLNNIRKSEIKQGIKCEGCVTTEKIALKTIALKTIDYCTKDY